MSMNCTKKNNNGISFIAYYDWYINRLPLKTKHSSNYWIFHTSI